MVCLLLTHLDTLVRPWLRRPRPGRNGNIFTKNCLPSREGSASLRQKYDIMKNSLENRKSGESRTQKVKL